MTGAGRPLETVHTAEAFRRGRVREGLRVTQTSVAGLVGVLPQRISAWELGVHTPGAEQALKWDEVLAQLCHEKLAATRDIKDDLPKAGPADLAGIRVDLGIGCVAMSRIMKVADTTLWRWETGRCKTTDLNIVAWRLRLTTICLDVRRVAIRHGGVQ